MVTRTITYYNLDTIISVGFRVSTKRGNEYRQWANSVCIHPSPSISAIDARLCRLLPTGRKNHDRFLIIDDVVYLFGASLKDAGKKLFAYIKMQETPAAELLNNIR